MRDQELPTSIYQIEGQKRCAIEFCSLSKTAGFTGVRCGHTVVPHELIRGDAPLNELWLRCPDGMSSWEYFDALLTRANIVGTPGAGFGTNGEGSSA